jgi:hypothetical protein
MFRYDNYMKSDSVRNKRERSGCKFQDITVPYRKDIHAIINK